MSQPTSALPHQPNPNPFIENELDVTGYLAFIHYLFSVKGGRIQSVFISEIAESSETDVVIFRAFAKQCLDDHISRVVNEKSDAIRDGIYQSTFRDTLRTSYDSLISKQEAGFEKIISSVVNSSGTYRQIFISIVASFVFGVIISLARFVDAPFNIPFLQHGTAPNPNVPSQVK